MIICSLGTSSAYTGYKTFDCNNHIINNFVKNNLLTQVKRSVTSAFVLIDETHSSGQLVAGFITINSFSISLDRLSALQLKGLPKQIPCTRIVMLGVDKQYQGKGYGLLLMQKAFSAIKSVSQTVGTFGVYLDADSPAIPFYTKLGFSLLEGDLSPNPSPMFIPLSAIP